MSDDHHPNPMPESIVPERTNGFAPPARGGIQSASLAAATAQATAEVQARYLMARAQPRNPMAVWQALTNECRRPAFADVALYQREVGGKMVNGRWEKAYATGLSIRFAEAALSAWGNLDVRTTVVYDDDDTRVVRVTATDLQNNAHISTEQAIAKTVERSKPKEDDIVLSQRTNSYGKPVFTVRANESAFAPKQGAAVSKMLRDVVLRLIPGDIKQDAINAIQQTRRQEDKTDPTSAVKRIVAGMGRINIPVAEIEEFLGHQIATVSPAEVEELRNVYSQIGDGDASWNDILTERRKSRIDTTAKPKPDAKPDATDALKGAAGVKAKKAEAKKPESAPEDDGDEAQRQEYLAAIEQMDGKHAPAIATFLRGVGKAGLADLTRDEAGKLYNELKGGA